MARIIILEKEPNDSCSQQLDAYINLTWFTLWFIEKQRALEWQLLTQTANQIFLKDSFENLILSFYWEEYKLPKLLII